MKAILNNIFNLVLALVIADLFVMFFMMSAIASGEEVIHIPFWDAQLRLLVDVL